MFILFCSTNRREKSFLERIRGSWENVRSIIIYYQMLNRKLEMLRCIDRVHGELRDREYFVYGQGYDCI